MNIFDYDPETGTPDLNIERATVELATIGKTTFPESTRKAMLAEIQIAALLDIAGSLRIVAMDAAAALGQLPTAPAPALSSDDADEAEPERDFLIVGDLVHILDNETVHEVLRVGVSESELWAEIEDNGPVRYWQRNLVRLRGDESPDPDPLAEVIVEPTLGDLRDSPVPLVGVATEAETPALLTDEDEDGEEAVGGYELDVADEVDPADLVDDIDADFDGDEHPTTESALAALRKLEKPSKKAAPKKGKKS